MPATKPRRATSICSSTTNSKFSLLELVGIKLLLEKKLGVPVDVTTRDSLHPMLRAEIEQSAVRVF